MLSSPCHGDSCLLARRGHCWHTSSHQSTPQYNRCTRLLIAAEAKPDCVPSADLVTEGEKFQKLLQRAKDLTFRAPGGQLHGRAGRRCVLEDGERMLLHCLRIRPASIEARTTLMHNLIAQNRGREMEVPGAALDMLEHSKLKGCRQGSSHEAEAGHIVELGLMALRKGHRSSDSLRRFITEALKHVPELAEPVIAMAAREHYVTSKQARTLSVNGSFDEDLL